MQTKPTLGQQAKDHLMVWLLNHPEHAVRIEKARKWLRSQLS